MSSVRAKSLTVTGSLVGIAAAVFAWVVYERGVQAEFAANALRAAKDVSMSYDAAVKENAEAMKASAEGTQQKAALEKLEAISDEPVSEREKDAVAVVLRIGRIQSAAFSLMGSLSEVQAQKPAFAAFQKAIGDKSPLSERIAEYNEAARGWNRHSTALLGSVVQDTFGQDGRELPYLRIDGMEDDMSIQL